MEQAKKLLSSGLVVISGTLIGSAFSYLYNMMMGRMLGPVEYGELASLLSLVTIVAVASGAILTISMRFAGELFGLKNFLGIKRVLKTFSKYSIFLGIILVLVCFLLINPIKDFLSIDKTIPLVIAFSSFVFLFPIMVNRGIIQGIQKFLPLTVVNSLEMAIRLLLGVLLVKLGFDLSGALLGFVLATALAYVITFWPLKKIISLPEKSSDAQLHFNKKEVLSYSWPTLVTALFLVVGINLDILLVKHFFPAEQAGIYAAISTIGKIIFYALGPLISVMFPLISEKRARGEKHYQTFFLSLALTVVIGVLAVGVYSTVPGFIIKILYGSQYLSFYYLLPQVGIFILFYTLINLIANYFMAVKDFNFLWFYGGVLIAMYLVLESYHPNLTMVLRVFTSGFGLLFALMIGYYLFTKRAQIKSLIKGTYGEEFTEIVNNNPGL